MPKQFLTISILCCALAVGLGAQNRGQGSDHGGRGESREFRPPFKWWTVDRIKQELKLSTDQSAEIEKVFQVSMDRLRVDKDDLDRAQTTFSQLMEKPAVTDRDMSRAVDQLELARYNVSKERTMMLVRIHNILTPDQRKQLDAIHKRDEGDKSRQQH